MAERYNPFLPTNITSAFFCQSIAPYIRKITVEHRGRKSESDYSVAHTAHLKNGSRIECSIIGYNRSCKHILPNRSFILLCPMYHECIFQMHVAQTKKEEKE